MQLGDSVIIAEDSEIRKRWPIGHVVEVFIEQDGGVCSAESRQLAECFTAPLQRYALCKKLMVSRGAGMARWSE